MRVPRLAAERRFAAIVQSVIDELGNPNITPLQLALVHRLASTLMLAEAQNVKLTRGEVVAASDHATITTAIMRLTARLRLSLVPPADELPRVPKNIGAAIEAATAELAAQHNARPL